MSMPKISSIHKFDFKIQQILGSHKLKGLAYPKIIEATFSFPEFVALCKKSVYSNCSFLRYNHFYSPMTRLITPIFDHPYPKNYWSFFFLEFASTHKKSGYFIDFFWRYCLFKNTVTWFAESTLTHISWKRFLPNIEYVQERSKFQ